QRYNKGAHPPLRCRRSCRWKLVGISHSQSRLSIYLTRSKLISTVQSLYHGPTFIISDCDRPSNGSHSLSLSISLPSLPTKANTQKTFFFSFLLLPIDLILLRLHLPAPIKIRRKEPNYEAMMVKWSCFVVVLIAAALLADVSAGDSSDLLQVKKVKGERVCTKGWECKSWSKYCCNETISDYFQVYNFEQIFAKRNTPVAHAVGFWDYQSFIIAASDFEHLGFGTTGGPVMGQKEMAAFFGHVGSKTSCGYGVATGGPLAWGLCYNREMSPNQDYCDNSDEYKYTYPCNPGANYYGRGAIPVYWNYNYGRLGEALKVDLLAHPEYLEQNATLAFQAAIYTWMTPKKKHQPSAHDAFVGNWVPTKNDTLSNRVCGQGDIDEMNTLVSHYLYYLDELGIGREQGGNNTVVSCADQKAFNPRAVSPTASS
ncbi:hypothetical protein V2J09_010115, partial [Rumex salicifolius]